VTIPFPKPKKGQKSKQLDNEGAVALEDVQLSDVVESDGSSQKKRKGRAAGDGEAIGSDTDSDSDAESVDSDDYGAKDKEAINPLEV
jgi:hypothetical protein